MNKELYNPHETDFPTQESLARLYNVVAEKAKAGTDFRYLIGEPPEFDLGYEYKLEELDLAIEIAEEEAEKEIDRIISNGDDPTLYGYELGGYWTDYIDTRNQDGKYQVISVTWYTDNDRPLQEDMPICGRVYIDESIFNGTTREIKGTSYDIMQKNEELSIERNDGAFVTNHEVQQLAEQVDSGMSQSLSIDGISAV